MTRLQAVGVMLVALGLIYALLYAAWLRKRRHHESAAIAAERSRTTRDHALEAPALKEKPAQVIAEGICLANFEGASYKTGELPCVFLEAATVQVGSSSAAVENSTTSPGDRSRIASTSGSSAFSTAWPSRLTTAAMTLFTSASCSMVLMPPSPR